MRKLKKTRESPRFQVGGITCGTIERDEGLKRKPVLRHNEFSLGQTENLFMLHLGIDV